MPVMISFLLSLSHRFFLPSRAASVWAHLYVLNRNCGDGWHKITPTGCERHSDIAFFLSFQPLPHSLHPHQIFFYSSLRGKQGGRLRRELTHTECRHSPLYPALIPNFTHSCTWTHTCSSKRSHIPSAAAFFFYSPQSKPQCSFSLSV